MWAPTEEQGERYILEVAETREARKAAAALAQSPATSMIQIFYRPRKIAGR